MADDTNTAEREAAEQWLRDRYGAYRGHFAWRELEEAFLAGRASLAASAGSEPVASSEDVQKKIQSNTWDHFSAILPTLKAISRGDWYWGANSRCKYIEIRLDTRDGGCLLFDRERVRISPEQFAHQSYGGVKMEPWPATDLTHPSPPEGMVAVPKEFIRAFSDTAHNYQLSVEPPDHFSGTEGDAFRAAYARCGVELLRLRGILIGPLPASEAKEL